MAQLAVLMAGLLLIAESNASDVADRSALQGFLSKYERFGSDALKSSVRDYDKFITPSFNRVKPGNGLDASQRLDVYGDHGETGWAIQNVNMFWDFAGIFCILIKY